jgi:DNA gyrase/topoisomerase IV subunit B
MIYFYSESEKDEKLPNIKEKYIISRCKGLGELMPEVMSETAMNPETRTLIKVTVYDAKKMIASLEKWMGPDVTDRKETISSKLSNYIKNYD